MISLLVAGGVALLLAVGGTPLLIRWLQARGIGQQIREEGPERHLAKAGTPTMGGLAIVVAAFGGYLAAHAGPGVVFTRSGVLVILTIVGAGIVGLVDDWLKFRYQRSLGLNKRAKLAGQFVVAVVFAVLAERWASVSTYLSLTRQRAIDLNLHTAGCLLHHHRLLGVPPPRRLPRPPFPRPGHRVGRHDRGVHRLPLVERRARPDLHG